VVQQKATGDIMQFQELQIWIGFGFVVGIVVFFMVAYFVPPNSPNAFAILRFLCALCAGLAGALITGGALFELKAELSAGVNMMVQGTAGFAAFFAIWFTFPAPPGYIPLTNTDFNVSIPQGCTFQQAATVIANADNASVSFDSKFTSQELAAPLDGIQLHTKSPAAALDAIRLQATTVSIQMYRVVKNGASYSLVI
jgi:hypothetical protein